jgi:replicative DNA helicase
MNAFTEPEHLRAPDDEAPAMPWSQEAEQAVLGSLLLDNTMFDRVSDSLTERSFWHHPHGTIYGAIAVLVSSNKPADVLTVFEALKTAGKADECGGMRYLNAMSESVPSARNARRYALLVADKAAERAIISAADEALRTARGTGTPTEKLEQIAKTFAGLEREQTKQAPRRLSEMMARAIDRYSDMANGDMEPAWRTGIGPLDRILSGGVRPGKLYCLAARPSIGKSSAARAIGINLAGDDHPVLLLSQEMPDDEVADCIVAQLGGVDSEHLQTGKLDDYEWGAVSSAVDRGGRLPFYVDDEGGLTLSQIRAKARSIKGLQVLVLDYLQLSTSTLKNATTNDQVAEISKGLKQLALQMRIAVVVLSQLSRKVEDRADKEPQLSDLRDSGAIEQDIDVAVMLWTAREFNDGARRIVGWKVPKHRGGRKGRFAMQFDAPIYRWTETDASIDPPTATERRSRGEFE